MFTPTPGSGFFMGAGGGGSDKILDPPPLEISQMNNTNWGVKIFFLRHECIQKKMIPYLREIGQNKFCQTFFILFSNPKIVILTYKFTN